MSKDAILCAHCAGVSLVEVDPWKQEEIYCPKCGEPVLTSGNIRLHLTVTRQENMEILQSAGRPASHAHMMRRAQIERARSLGGPIPSIREVRA